MGSTAGVIESISVEHESFVGRDGEVSPMYFVRWTGVDGLRACHQAAAKTAGGKPIPDQVVMVTQISDRPSSKDRKTLAWVIITYTDEGLVQAQVSLTSELGPESVFDVPIRQAQLL